MADISHQREEHLLDQVGKALRDSLENLRQIPVPERWVDLLKRLNAEEEIRGQPRR
jgi:hypothetical protein